MPTEQDRFRAFAEQYVVSRAPSFKLGDEQQGGWQAALDAKTIYDTIVSVSQKYVPPTVPSPPAAQSNNAAGRRPSRMPPMISMINGEKPSPRVQSMIDHFNHMRHSGASATHLHRLEQLIVDIHSAERELERQERLAGSPLQQGSGKNFFNSADWTRRDEWTLP